jgi:HSP20 family molecular chaperone IbpA
MSLPFPSTGSNNNNSSSSYVTSNSTLDNNAKQSQAMDAPLIALTQQCKGDLRQVLYSFFSFLHRRTDFYLVPHPEDVHISTMGFIEGDAEKILLAAFRQFPLRRLPHHQGTATTGGSIRVREDDDDGPPKTSESLASTTTPMIPSTQAGMTAVVSTVTNLSQSDNKIEHTKNDSVNDVVVAVDATLQSSVPTSDDPYDDSIIPSNMKGVKYHKENGLQIPVGNGGSTPRYKWTQTLEEITVLIGIPKILHGKDLDVSITCSKLSIKSKQPLPGQKTSSPHIFLQGDLVERIRADESTWTVEGGVMIVTLDKLKKQFWSTVLVGDERIDTDLVDSRRHISDYDETTQAQIRKIVFDQTQYHKGLPSSDDEIILGSKTSKIPPLPAGVEYIDKKRLDAAVENKKSASIP